MTEKIASSRRYTGVLQRPPEAGMTGTDKAHFFEDDTGVTQRSLGAGREVDCRSALALGAYAQRAQRLPAVGRKLQAFGQAHRVGALKRLQDLCAGALALTQVVHQVG